MALMGVLLLLLGLGVWWTGRRGFSVGSHPHCRACGFDLYGLPPQRERCPECGNNILAEGSIRVGFRQRVLAVMVLGAGVGLIGAGLAAAGIASWWPTFDGSRYKPLAWLERDLDASEPVIRHRACAEIERRITGGALTSPDLDQLAEVILRFQADPAIPWDNRWGDLVQASRATPRTLIAGTGRLSTARWQQYLSQALQIDARVRPRVRLDDPIPIGVSCHLRAGSKYADLLHIGVQPSADVSLGTYRSDLQGQRRVLNVVPMPMEWVMLWFPTEAQKDMPLALSPAHQNLKLKVTVSADSDGAKGIQTATFSLPFELLARTESSVTLSRALPSGMPAAAEWDRAMRLRGPFNEHGDLLMDRVGSARLFVVGPPICASFRAVLRQHDREWVLARFMVREDDATLVRLSLPPPAPRDGPEDGPAQIICCPEPEQAAATVDVMEVWGEPIVRDVTIRVSENH